MSTIQICLFVCYIHKRKHLILLQNYFYIDFFATFEVYSIYHSPYSEVEASVDRLHTDSRSGAA